MKDYLATENQRNKTHAALYTAIMKEAFGADCEVLIGHHLTFEQGGDLSTENEIPSADCLMFDHEVMTKVFGESAITLMRYLAATPMEQRDSILKQAYEGRVGGLPRLGPFIAGPDGWEVHDNKAAAA